MNKHDPKRCRKPVLEDEWSLDFSFSKNFKFSSLRKAREVCQEGKAWQVAVMCLETYCGNCPFFPYHQPFCNFPREWNEGKLVPFFVKNKRWERKSASELLSLIHAVFGVMVEHLVTETFATRMPELHGGGGL